jgi:hypothetical protein
MSAALDEQHELFRKYAGTHTDYDEHGKRDLMGVLPQSTWPLYYDNSEPVSIDEASAEPVGWFGCTRDGRER